MATQVTNTGLQQALLSFVENVATHMVLRDETGQNIGSPIAINWGNPTADSGTGEQFIDLDQDIAFSINTDSGPVTIAGIWLTNAAGDSNNYYVEGDITNITFNDPGTYTVTSYEVRIG